MLRTLHPETVRILQACFNEHNEYVHVYRNAYERFLADPNTSSLCIRQVRGGHDPRVYNTPSTNTEVAAVIIGAGDRAMDDGRDFWVHRHGDRAATKMPEINPFIHALAHSFDTYHRC